MKGHFELPWTRSNHAHGLAVSPDDAEIHVVDVSSDRIFTYSSSGTFLRSTRVDFHGTAMHGLDVHPTTGEFVLVDRGTDQVLRFGGGLTRHVPTPSTQTQGLVSSAPKGWPF